MGGVVDPNVLILSNKKWMMRLNIVIEMEQWVAENLKDRGLYDVYDRSECVKLSKAKEYLYGYLFWGRRNFTQDSDPLFFYDDGVIQDESLVNQMNHGKYTVFVRLLQEKFKQVMNFDPVSIEKVTMDVVNQYLVGSSHTVIENCRSKITDTANTDEHIIGLILRYRCIGGFESNLHGSVPEAWKTLLVDFTECFASPLNNKFDRFHSMFTEDGPFGGSVDFFNYVKQSGNILPQGKYEINPPFHLALLDQVAGIVSDSFHSDSGPNLRVVMVVPDWGDADFVKILDSVCDFLKPRGVVYIKKYDYKHSNGQPLSTRTRFYVLVGGNIPSSDVSSLFSNCRNLIYGEFSENPGGAARGWAAVRGTQRVGGGGRGRLYSTAAAPRLAKFTVTTEKFSATVTRLGLQ